MGIALIGGASRGIGRATALLLAQEGYTVAVNYHHNINAATEGGEYHCGVWRQSHGAAGGHQR